MPTHTPTFPAPTPTLPCWIEGQDLQYEHGSCIRTTLKGKESAMGADEELSGHLTQRGPARLTMDQAMKNRSIIFLSKII